MKVWGFLPSGSVPTSSLTLGDLHLGISTRSDFLLLRVFGMATCRWDVWPLKRIAILAAPHHNTPALGLRPDHSWKAVYSIGCPKLLALEPSRGANSVSRSLHRIIIPHRYALRSGPEHVVGLWSLHVDSGSLLQYLHAVYVRHNIDD